jgi:hypothetical protein
MRTMAATRCTAGGEGPASPASALRGWIPLLTCPIAVLTIAPAILPRWAVMWLAALAMYGGCKWLTWRRSTAAAPPAIHIGYLTAWVGMDADRFLMSGSTRRPLTREWVAASAKLAGGLSLFFVVARYVWPVHPRLAGWVGMTGLVLTLHFGLFHLLSCAWRRCGIAADPLMDRPLLGSSLSEVWGRRGNRAFRDLTHRFVFRPLTERVGYAGAVLGAFVISGLVHDLVISVPAGGGYGGPTTFFAVQGAGMLAERSTFGRRLRLSHGWRGRLLLFLALGAPLWWLFHPPFVEAVVLPCMSAWGAL